ncbi:uncharacterized protein TNCV_549581 [Trichonephila clavipes]|nr:uncharacterized protein TNCV_549581 [Trichonephila clavipes]
MNLYDVLSDFLSDKSEMKHLKTVDGKVFVSYLKDIFEKLNLLNKKLQGSNKTLLDVKMKIFGFVIFIEVCQKNISHKNFDQFHWLKTYEVTDAAVLVIVDHLKLMASDFKERFSDLKQIDFPTWVTQPMLVGISDISIQYHGVLGNAK